MEFYPYIKGIQRFKKLLVARQTGIKDYGHIFPGHGGVLDRFDSVIFVAPFAEFLFRIVF